MSVKYKKFKDRLIGLDSERYTGGGMDWPPYSPDLNPCDYFLWGYLKDKVYRTESKTLDELRNAIKREIKEIGPSVLEKVIQNVEIRLRHGTTTQGPHFENHLIEIN